MASADRAPGRLRPMGEGDRAVLYVTRGAYHNPPRDLARLGGLATVLDEPARRRRPVVIGGREFVWTVPIRVDVALPEREGPEVQPMTPKLSFVKRPEVWGMYFRNSPKQIPKKDFALLERAVHNYEKEHSRD